MNGRNVLGVLSIVWDRGQVPGLMMASPNIEMNLILSRKEGMPLQSIAHIKRSVYIQ